MPDGSDPNAGDLGPAFFRQDRDRVQVFETPATDAALTLDTTTRSAFDYLARGAARWRAVSLWSGWYVRLGLAFSGGYQALRLMRGHVGTTFMSHEVEMLAVVGAIAGGLGVLILLRQQPVIGYVCAAVGITATILLAQVLPVALACLPVLLTAIADVRAWALGRQHARALQDLLDMSVAIRRDRVGRASAAPTRRAGSDVR